VVIAGMISGLERRVNKEGKAWAIAKIEDLTGTIEVLFFPKTYELFGTELVEDRLVAVQGRVNRRENTTSIFGSDLKILEFTDSELSANPPVVLVLEVAKVSPQLTADLKRVLDSHRGRSPVHLKLRNGQRTTLLNLPNCTVEPSIGLRSELKGLLGAGCFE
jgi:DNA polymerase-3 subunit alpha